MESEAASPGRPLGKVLEALQALAAKTATPRPEIDALVAGVEAVKASTRAGLKAEAERALLRLKAVDERAWRELTGG